MDKRELWWKQISGPQRFLTEVVSQTLRGGVILLCTEGLNEDFWTWYTEKLRMEDSNYTLCRMDDRGGDVGMEILARFFPRVEYDPLAENTACFIAEKGLLRDHVIIMDGVAPSKSGGALIADFGKRAAINGGTLIVPYGGQSPLAGKHKGVWDARLRNFVQLYDMQLFASMLCDREPVCAEVRMYEAQLAARIAQIDAEMCIRLLECDAKRNPGDALRMLAVSMPQAAAYLSDEAKLTVVLWEAQIHILFPFLEQERRRLILKYAAVLKRVLPIQDDFGNALTQPQDMEMRHMVYLRAEIYPGMEPADRERLSLYHDTRNQLAHLKVLSWGVIAQIFDGRP